MRDTLVGTGGYPRCKDTEKHDARQTQNGCIHHGLQDILLHVICVNAWNSSNVKEANMQNAPFFWSPSQWKIRRGIPTVADSMSKAASTIYKEYATCLKHTFYPKNDGAEYACAHYTLSWAADFEHGFPSNEAEGIKTCATKGRFCKQGCKTLSSFDAGAQRGCGTACFVAHDMWCLITEPHPGTKAEVEGLDLDVFQDKLKEWTSMTKDAKVQGVKAR